MPYVFQVDDINLLAQVIFVGVAAIMGVRFVIWFANNA